MSGVPNWKVFNPKGQYIASCKHPEDAGAIVACYGKGASIRWGHRKQDTMYTDGVDGSAGHSYDIVAEVCRRRFHEMKVRDGLI